MSRSWGLGVEQVDLRVIKPTDVRSVVREPSRQSYKQCLVINKALEVVRRFEEGLV
jgi:hypothetical protein